MKEILFIFLGGGTGSVLRYLMQSGISGTKVAPFPLNTFVINISGSLLIGVFYSLSERFNLSLEVRLLLTLGLCGGFTTFSTFSAENLMLLRNDNYGTFFLYAFGSLILGIVATFMGMWVSKSL